VAQSDIATGVEIERPTTGSLGRGVVALLALSVFINYVDRGNVATAAPLIQSELHLSNTAVGLLISAFFWTYTPGQLLAAWLAERINAYRTLALGLAIWSLATFFSGLASGFVALFVLRLVLGLGECAAFPCSSKLFARHLPGDRLGFANGMIGVGLALGPAFGTIVGGLLMARLGWRPSFLIFGAISLLWLWPWLRATREASRKADETKDDATPSYLAILSHPEAWGACLGHFSANYAFYFFISWLPLYLVKTHGFTIKEMAALGGLIYVIYAVSSQATGWLSDAWIRNGGGVNLVRKTMAIVAHSGMALCFVICALGGPTLSLASLVVAAIFFGFNTPSIYSIGQTLAGAHVGGKWIALQNCVGNLAGIVGPPLTGYLTDITGNFAVAFATSGAISLMGVLAWGVIIRRVAPVDWNDRLRPLALQGQT
jgi:MFS family permease